MSDPLKEMFGDSGMTPEQEKKFFERMAKQKNEEIKALENKKKLKGKYRRTQKEAKQTIFLPMLAQNYFKQKKLPKFPIDIQPKLDGVRCMAKWEDDRVVLMSRGGEEYIIPHISKEIEQFLPEGSVLDGEIYIHGVMLQTINNYINTPQKATEQLQYHVYDGFHEETRYHPWERRRRDLDILMDNCPAKRVLQVGTWRCDTKEEIDSYLNEFIFDDYEGAILRTLTGPYLLSHRS